MGVVIYAAGEIRSNWHEQRRGHLAAAGVDTEIVGPQEVHGRSASPRKPDPLEAVLHG